MVKKYIKVNGIMKINPEWKAQQKAGGGSGGAVPFTNQSTALAVVSHPGEMSDGEIVVTPMYQEAVDYYSANVEPAIAVPVAVAVPVGGAGTDGGTLLNELNQVLAKYEVPSGMLSKLLELKNFDVAEIIVDDSGSMTLPTDAKGADGRLIKNRWWEAKNRISEMTELMAYVQSPPVYVRFLNRTGVIELKRNPGESPKAYVHRIEGTLSEAFSYGPTGTTPALEALRASFQRYNGNEVSVLRYFMGDGLPNGGAQACRAIEDLLIRRPNPARNPFTFMSCTNQDGDTEWMKECEERAPYCSEFDDYGDESREILKDQGKAFPYSYGLHLVGQLVAAFNPHDLDAMDESIPFTKHTLDNVLGYQSSPQEYKYYYDSFIEAQHKLQLKSYQRAFVNQLPSLFEQFMSARTSLEIPAAAQYKKQLTNAMNHERQQQQQQQQRNATVPQDECCVIL